MSTADAVIYAKEISDIVRCAATSAAIVRLPTIWPELCNFQSYFIVDKKGDQIHQTIAQAVVVSKWNNLNYPLKILKLRCNNDGVKGESRVQGGAHESDETGPCGSLFFLDSPPHLTVA